MSFRFIFLIILSFAFSELGHSQTTAKVDSLVLAADTMIRDLKANKIFLKGNVLLIFQGQNVRADNAVIDTQKKIITAEGSLSLVSATARAVGERAEFNYEDNTGILYDALIEQGAQIQLTGKVIRKISEDEYVVESGNFTACTTCPPAWNFSGSKIHATIGKYAYITHTVMYLGSIPIFYLPYMVVPIATERQTGFLFPSLGYGSSSKFVLSQPFFWAMSDSSDSTWTLENYQARGQKGSLNYRYKLSKESQGDFNTSYIQDAAFGQELRDNGNRLNDTEKVQRSSIHYQHYYELPDGYVQKTSLNWVSDTLYPRDFPTDIRAHGDPALVSRVSLTKNDDNQHISAEVVHNQNMMISPGPISNRISLEKDPRGADDISIHRFPSVLYYLTPQKLAGNLLFEVESRYDNFTRSASAFDKLKNSGGVKTTPIEIDPNPTSPDIYNSRTDLIRTGQRLEVEPKISYPFNLGPYLDINPSISFRESDYEFAVGEQASAYRRYVRGTISARTQFGRTFGNRLDPKATRYKHEIQPEIVYTNIGWSDASKHPFFGDSDPFYKHDQAIGNADIPQFDDFDRLYDRHLTTFNLTNYLIEKSPSTAGSNYNQLLTLKISQSYDNYEADRVVRQGEAREPWSPLTATLDVRLPFLDSNSQARYYHYDKITSISSRLRLLTKYQNYLQFTYSQDFQLKKVTTEDLSTGLFNTKTDMSNYNQSLNNLAGYRAKYAGAAGFITYNILSQRFSEYGYVVDLFPPGDCWSISFGEVRPISESRSEVFYFFNININYGMGSNTYASNGMAGRFR